MSKFITICCPVHVNQTAGVLPGGGGYCRYCGREMVDEDTAREYAAMAEAAEVAGRRKRRG